MEGNQKGFTSDVQRSIKARICAFTSEKYTGEAMIIPLGTGSTRGRTTSAQSSLRTHCSAKDIACLRSQALQS